MFALAKRLTASIGLALSLYASEVLAGPVEVLWLGHSTFRITSVEGKVIVIDPFLQKNPMTPPEYRDLAKLGQADLILVTHGHLEGVAFSPSTNS